MREGEKDSMTSCYKSLKYGGLYRSEWLKMQPKNFAIQHQVCYEKYVQKLGIDTK